MIEWEYIVALVAILMGSLIFLIPLAAFALRFASKPIIEAFARYREVQGGLTGQQAQVLRDRIQLLEKRVEALEGGRAALAPASQEPKAVEAGGPEQLESGGI